MFLIQRITSNPYQKQTLVLQDGTSLIMTMYFRPMQYGWWVEQLQYLSFTINGLRITNSPNMLNQFRNQIPFGLACFSKANREPTQQEDFSTGNSQLYILGPDEVAQYAGFLKLG